MVTVVGDIAIAGVTALALVLSTWPFAFELHDDGAVELCLFGKEFNTRNL
jgi:hypothetical protein